MPDVNIFVYAHRADEKTHAAYRRWLEEAMNDPQPIALSVLVAIGFMRVVTNPAIYATPTPPRVAIAAIEEVIAHPRCRIVLPGPDHLERVLELCRRVSASGKLVADAQHAALAISEGCTWVTRDGDFARFAPHGLSWKHLRL
jgi:toxin-antitoxin system PIN domain toxin